MSAITSARRWFGRTRGEHAEARALTRGNVPPVMLPAGSGGQGVTPAGALRIADAWACIRALADAAASLPLHAYRRVPGGRERVENPAAELLRRPAPAVTQSGLIGQLVTHLNLYGNAFLGLYRDGGEIAQLGLLHPDTMSVEVKGGRPLYTYADPVSGARQTLTTADVIHVRALSADGIMGLSPIRQAREALGLSRALTEHAARFFENDARPSGILKVDGALTSDQAEYLRTAWDARHRGVDRSHRIALMSGEVEFVSVSMPMDDAQFLEQRKLSTVEVARIFRVPPWIIGADSGESMTYSNTEQQSLHFATYSLRPWLVTIEQALSANRELFPAGTYCEFTLDALLRADSATRAQVYTAALNPDTGWMTRQEVRQLENLDPEPERRAQTA